MNKEKSIEILQACLDLISNMTQEEFDKREKELGLDKINLYNQVDNSDFEIITDKILTRNYICKDCDHTFKDNSGVDYCPECNSSNIVVYRKFKTNKKRKGVYG